MVKMRRFPPPEPYVVAAIDGNHGGRLAMARRLVALAAETGADAVKASMGNGSALSLQAWRALRRETSARGIDFVAAPHDAAGFAAARAIKPDIYQIDPAVLGNLELVKRIARERRPVIVIAGACTALVLDAVVAALKGRPIVILHTVAAAALAPAAARLRYLDRLAHRYKAPVGYLGNEPGIGWSFVAAALGAAIIERPFTVDRALPGGQHASSIDASELAAIVHGLADLRSALAPVGDRRVFADELPGLEKAAQSLVARRALRRGARLRAADIDLRAIAGGIGPRLKEWAVGRRLKYDVEAGEPLTFGVVEVS